MEFPAASSVEIVVHCPQCGGTISFLEEAYAIHCAFCGSALFVSGRGRVLRYVLPPRMADVEEALSCARKYLLRRGRRSPRPAQAFLFYAPFWRIQGIAYRWVFGERPMKVESELGDSPPMERVKVFLTRLMDHTIPGYAGLEIGLPSLGVRPQALQLHLFAQEHLEQKEPFLPLEVPLEKVQAEAERIAEAFLPVENLIPEVILQRIVGLVLSVVYFPLWYVECQPESGREVLLLDAAGQSLIQTLPDGSPLLSKLQGAQSRESFPFSEIRFLPLRCPNCGWSFPFRHLSLLHFCANCRRLFHEEGGEWKESRYFAVSPPDGRPQEKWLWLPFWQSKVAVESAGERIETMAGLYKMAPPPRAVNEEREARRSIYFYVPAVKFSNPQVLQQMASRLSFMQPDLKLTSFPDGAHPLTAGGNLLKRDAQEMGPMILGSMIPQSNKKVRAWLKGCRVTLAEEKILYFPFSQADLFWKEATTGISFQRNALSKGLLEQEAAGGKP